MSSVQNQMLYDLWFVIKERIQDVVCIINGTK